METLADIDSCKMGGNMSFSKNVSDNVLVDSKRCCTLCHKFCGFKIELHHIKQKADGGEDTYENCIPLCFDCHAEVKSYNPNHPKGKKYSENELIMHRDRWFKKVKTSSLVNVDEKYLVLDREIFQTIKKAIYDDGTILFLHEHNFAHAFELERLNLTYGS